MKLKEKTSETLIGELNVFKAITVALIFVMLLLIGVCIYGLLTKENNTVFFTLLIIPLALIPILLINAGNMKKIKAELESRK